MIFSRICPSDPVNGIGHNSPHLKICLRCDLKSLISFVLRHQEQFSLFHYQMFDNKLVIEDGNNDMVVTRFYKGIVPISAYMYVKELTPH